MSKTFDDIYQAYYDHLRGYGSVVSELKVAPNVFGILDQHFIDEQAEREREGIKSLPPEKVQLSTLYGIRVVVDSDMEPGTYKFESVQPAGKGKADPIS